MAEKTKAETPPKSNTIEVDLDTCTIALTRPKSAKVAALKSPPKAIRSNASAVFAMHLDIVDRYVTGWKPKPGSKLPEYSPGMARRLTPAQIEKIVEALADSD